MKLAQVLTRKHTNKIYKIIQSLILCVMCKHLRNIRKYPHLLAMQNLTIIRTGELPYGKMKQNKIKGSIK